MKITANFLSFAGWRGSAWGTWCPSHQISTRSSTCSRCHRSSHHMRRCVIITSLVSTQLCYAYLNCQDRSKVTGYLDNHVNEVCWFDFWRFLLFLASGLMLATLIAERWYLLTGLHDLSKMVFSKHQPDPVVLFLSAIILSSSNMLKIFSEAKSLLLPKK